MEELRDLDDEQRDAEDELKSAKEELKRVDHLIYVSLKYTRTVDVIHNVLERLISSFDFVSMALLDRSLEKDQIKEIPHAPKLKCEELERIYKDDDKILLAIKEYLLLRRIIRTEYERENEYRRHVGMLLDIDGVHYTINIDQVTEYYKKAQELIEHIEEHYND